MNEVSDTCWVSKEELQEMFKAESRFTYSIQSCSQRARILMSTYVNQATALHHGSSLLPSRSCTNGGTRLSLVPRVKTTQLPQQASKRMRQSFANLLLIRTGMRSTGKLVQALSVPIIGTHGLTCLLFVQHGQRHGRSHSQRVDVRSQHRRNVECLGS